MIKPLLFASLMSITFNVKAEPGAHHGTLDGRYQLVQISEFRKDQFLLDTQTGKIWLAICYGGHPQQGDCEFYGWKPEDVIGLTISQKDFEKKAYGDPAPKSAEIAPWNTNPPKKDK